MSGLYNAVFGRCPFDQLLLKAIGIKVEDIPRYRDCYLTDNNEIVIYTRTGGGNREYYEKPMAANDEIDYKGPYNEDLRNNPYFERDEDDSFDSTYAYFYYQIPSKIKSECKLLKEFGAVRDPHKSWAQLMEQLTNSNSRDPAVQEAKRVIQELLIDALKSRDR